MRQAEPSSDLPRNILAKPLVIPRDQHPVSRKDIAEPALKVLYRLHNAGYEAFLVGGCVRDLLLGIQPKDFDVATSAKPEEVQKLFRNCRLVGRRFRLAHIMFGREIIEVATFRGHHSDSEENAQAQKHAKSDNEGMLLRDNVYGSIEEDAQRRDFTVNALYYNIADFSIHDFANGVRDIENGVLRMIGDAETRYREDPVRMLRAIRFATKLSMRMDASVADPIRQHAALLQNIPAARLFEESLKLFTAGKALANFEMLSDYHLFQQLFPQLKNYLKAPEESPYQMLRQTFADTDARLAKGLSITPAYLFAALLWWPLQARMEELMFESGLPPVDAMNIAAADVIGRQMQSIAVPKRFTIPAREIWQLQQRLERAKGKRVKSLLGHPRFRAAYDFLLLRAATATPLEQKKLNELAQFWTKQQEHTPAAPASDEVRPAKRRGRRGGRRRKKPGSSSSS
ncbi:polynucleotide adenylyltransferase PcnB [Pseudidiomarina terrestris]|uniref:Poly(A) polymerase I n=1 Tax=Pseudidiomarina terrestris TaxID=2820060 RepID=A0AAW7R2R4_9GAMM|nr:MULTISPECIES: polynucleotide adenylyltransferase PcnB [unclassified Pseudidiomarina]MDN7125267.1 polynucleotide adenylyltransferase PcnB [Pseudidiomarina sp. 1APP75-32.1]MDN7127332.1 polynucleotide adenylyltransferase PcnB [Pseudidiomarina sp. 1APR75-33.1]MDN7130026.1 polynucleotide adenylyltransferase PcnB [Pseudidiomarina sp. 1APR75-15]MDN7136178.1 polynucleotide adenylyltransferase PcnB [Pseudidiomarina sp. 1ASP75-5]MDN7138296.1 polynucleotide adenylyltransferase PcnB [Pseudidiomarina sp